MRHATVCYIQLRDARVNMTGGMDAMRKLHALPLILLLLMTPLARAQKTSSTKSKTGGRCWSSLRVGWSKR